MTQRITFPPGRLVWGNLYTGRDKDFDGNPLVFKNPADAGKPRKDYAFGVAIPKTPGQHWSASEWGKVIWQVGHSVEANAGQNAEFAWKVKDGDDAKLVNKPGHAGHWIVAFGSAFAPRIVNGVSGKFEDLAQPDYVNPGDYVQVQGDAKPNGSRGNPGVIINHNIVCFSGYGERIHVGVDASAVGFQTGPVAGASQAPVGAAIPPSVAPPAAAQVPPPYVAPAAATIAVPPNPAFTPPPPVVAAPPARVMTAKAFGATYEQLVAAGWTDEQLVQHGMMAHN